MKAEEQQETNNKRTKKEEDAMIMAVEELNRGKESKVTRKTGETRGGVDITIDVDKVSEKEFAAVEQFLREERRPLVVIKGYNPRRAVKLCQIQDIMGEFYTWELPRTRNSRTINEVMSKVGGKGILFKKAKLCTLAYALI